ncbi:bifunctional DNA-formamidopyrimidine glycosylase/DNA-(apurinic or apyrimidinic site) lyase [Kocuria sp. cx-455]|uniref:bifunctional DNA-formamidopyrimidine glycosylase/DNA-(apurinic or apyrimidinic site) lyase n=1 Tax=Kocuria sp. cx-455 TaxID=2771377 RepID=UPI001682EF02|nr:bifunctional DNA-formamidopyrimidine glycosylase/DNA-(apurinic or apyrimidinic site) lyase [Kocuria sp. cx-455]MBD2764761.1 bifunctional DNA-formamidopyrimidine glycosylase/DNA-(apurinic or apyrimidinic site) lyase [Kocuria sp. cx-455]
MPELPEVEVVRRGVANWVVGRTIEHVTVNDERSLRRHVAGPQDFIDRVTGLTVTDAQRRGKFLWLPVSEAHKTKANRALLVHLGMSGQLLVASHDQPAPRHERLRFELSPAPSDTGEPLPEQLRFVDQRIFGGMLLDRLVPSPQGGGPVPEHAAHIALDPLDPMFDAAAFHAALRRKKTGIKRALLDQGLISGIGNIYADEALWAAQLHWAAPTDTMTAAKTQRLIEACQAVMRRALDAGGTSFDSLYVNVNGESGRSSLNVYGREGRPCKRCGTPIVRERFMNRSSHLCPVCQRRR